MHIFEIEVFKVFVLVMLRISGLMVAAPVLGSRNVPPIAKVGLTGFTAFLVTPLVPAVEGGIPGDTLSFVLMGSGEVLIGLVIGFVMTMIFSAIQVAGQLMDMQSGFGMMNVFNPAMETQFPIFGFFFFIVTVLYLLITNGHHIMLHALISTFDKIPLGGFAVQPGLMYEVSTWGSVMYVEGLLIAAPVMGAMFLTYASMGLLGRVVPQIHLFVVGFPITIALGLLVVGSAIGVYLTILDDLFFNMFKNVETVIEGIG